MTTVTQTEMKGERALQPEKAGGWRGGFTNLLNKEMGQWWGTSMWWIQALIWVLILNGISTIVALTESLTSTALLEEVVQTFLPLGVGAVGIGVIITVQGAIVGEKQLGTAAWVMSKPASRSSFILSKTLSYAIGFGVTAICIPSIIFLITTRLLVPAPLSMMPFLAGAAVMVLSLLFYLSLTLMLGTLFDSRGPVAGIGVGIILIGLLLKGFIPMPVMMVSPWVLPDLSAGLALQTPLPAIWPVPIVASCFWVVLFTVVALWRFRREEF